jgi:hypothetical protein
LSGTLATSTSYAIDVGPNASTMGGIRMGATEAFPFTTQPPPVGPPTVTSTTPADSTVNVSVLATVTVDFSETMASNTTDAFSIAPAVAGTASLNGAVLTWTAASPLAYATTYSVMIATTADSASGGGPLAHSYRFSFQTQSAPASPPPAAKSVPTTVPWATVGAVAIAAIVLIALGIVWVVRRRFPPTRSTQGDGGAAPP